jgi:hypothetical protein
MEAAETTTYINLWRNPTTIHEALDLAERLKTLPEGIIRPAVWQYRRGIQSAGREPVRIIGMAHCSPVAI